MYDKLSITVHMANYIFDITYLVGQFPNSLSLAKLGTTIVFSLNYMVCLH